MFLMPFLTKRDQKKMKIVPFLDDDRHKRRQTRLVTCLSKPKTVEAQKPLTETFLSMQFMFSPFSLIPIKFVDSAVLSSLNLRKNLLSQKDLLSGIDLLSQNENNQTKLFYNLEVLKNKLPDF